MSGPRIYNLFPLLAGPVPAWADHLGRIAGMSFDWIYVNPFHSPGFSGSLYALVLTGVTKLGMVTPIGGVLFIVGWGALAVGMILRTPTTGETP